MPFLMASCCGWGFIPLTLLMHACLSSWEEADALRVLGRLEGVAEGELEALVGAKFESLCTCQIYGKLKASSKAADLWKARGIDELLRQFSPHRKVGYVEGPVQAAGGGGDGG